MTFSIPAAAYDRYMGRYSAQLAVPFADFAGVPTALHQGTHDATYESWRVLDVGCGTGQLTLELARRLGEARVAAADPTAMFLESCRSRLPQVDARLAAAETLPWGNREFDAALSQLAVSFMTDAAAGAREMRRVVRPGGRVAACMWEAGEAMQVVDLFWRAYAALKPEQVVHEPAMRYRTEGELRQLWQASGASDIEIASLPVASEYADFEDFWASLLGAAGPVGSQLATMGEPEREALRGELWQKLERPTSAFTLTARAWAVRGTNP